MSEKNKLFVGNFLSSVTKGDLRYLFASQGPVLEVKLVFDKVTRRPRGFAFVTMATAEAAQKAQLAFDGKELWGRPLKVDLAREPEEQDASLNDNSG